MTTKTRLSLIASGAVLVLVLALGVTAVFAQSGGDDALPGDDSAFPETTVPETTVPEITVPEDQLERPGFRGQRGMPGQFGPPEGLSGRDELLAEALNVDVETLEAARETARAAAIEQALAEQLITEEQAEMLLDGTFGPHRGHGFHGFDGLVDHEALLAEALNISVDDLQAAQQQAHEAGLAEMVEAGYLSEEEAELMAARQALKLAIDHKALLIEVLNISEAELEEALTSRESMAALIESSGLSAEEFGAAMQAAHEAAVEQAVEDGVITAEQYEALQNAGADTLGFGGHGFGGHGRGGHGRPGAFGGPGGSGSFRGFEQAPTTSPTANSI